jgi:catechol 2,3-dioxygenase-like lactoylglutathione lyase family enzyme
MKLTVLRVFVSDWPRAVRFYTETLGLPLAFSSEEIGWAQLDTGACQLAPERDRGESESDEPTLVGRFVGASLAVDDVEATFERLRARGVEFVAPPELMPWGGVLAHFRDPDGKMLTLVGPPRGVTPPRA